MDSYTSKTVKINIFKKVVGNTTFFLVKDFPVFK